jgi:hypothetical protein
MKGRKTFMPALILLSLFSCSRNPPSNKDLIIESSGQIIDSTEMTNNFYDNTKTYLLPLKEISIEGEIENPGIANLSSLTRRSVIVKETLLDSAGKDKFVGAYRYDGYSLFDILEKRIVKKANASEFSQIIDMFIEIENDKGDKVVFSWGEIYYPGNLHKIIIATGVSRIVPSKTKDQWELPSENKLVVGSDLITERNISSPVKITVKSYPKSFKVVKGLSPMYSGQISLFNGASQIGSITDFEKNEEALTYSTIFYGRGKGIHSTQPFSGVLLKNVLAGFYPVTRDNLKNGIMCIAAEDGYRCPLSYSELFNRNDQQEFLLIKTSVGEDGGLFRIFPASDFFSDRAIKSVKEICLGY